MLTGPCAGATVAFAVAAGAAMLLREEENAEAEDRKRRAASGRRRRAAEDDDEAEQTAAAECNDVARTADRAAKECRRAATGDRCIGGRDEI